MAPWDVVNAQIVLNFISEINDYYYVVYSRDKVKELRLDVLKCCERIKFLIERKEFHHETFRKAFCTLPLDITIIWMFIQAEIVTPEEYFSAQFQNEDQLQVLGLELFKLICSERDVLDKTVLAEMVSYLDSCYEMYSNASTEQLFKILYNAMKEQMELFAKLEIAMNSCRHVFKATVFRVFMKSYLLDGGQRVKDALADSKRYEPSGDTQLPRLVGVYVGAEIVSSNISEIVYNAFETSQTINWNHMANLVLCTLKICSEFVGTFKGAVVNIIERSLQDSNDTYLYSALLLGRILSLNVMSSGITYMQWYTSAFSSESHRPINTIARAKFFFNSMVHILDTEPPYYVKVHIHKAVSVPAACQRDLSDYLQLAKGRLVSMNESTEMGLFENLSGLHATENDVSCVVKQYEKTGKIASNILAALTFRRQYFEKTFLPLLLESCAGKSTPHHAVIVKLHGLGKISNTLFNMHKESCG